MSKVARVCEQCGADFLASKTDVKKGWGRFCSQLCMWKWRSENQRGSNNSNWKSVETTCEWCGKTFLVRPNLLRRGLGKYCSKDCHMASCAERWSGEGSPTWIGGKVETECEWCGKVLEMFPSRVARGNGRFCSKECKAAWESENVRGENHHGWQGGKIERICEQCGKIFEMWESQLAYRPGKFCSYRCMGDAKSGEESEFWMGGISFEPYGLEFNDTLREEIRQRDEYTCQLCGELQNGRAHNVHHIDYDKANNSPDNLITLCVSCHGTTGIDRDYWQNRLSMMMWQKYEVEQLVLEMV